MAKAHVIASLRALPARTAAVLCLGFAGFAASPAGAAEVPSLSDLSDLSLEQLADIQVSSVSKRDESLSRAPAAVFVITRDDIRRSGATSLPEALRLAPNLDVVRMNTAAYSVTARGFNSPESANKLLVLIDGRSVYTPLASTVFWESQDVPLADIERIEVISGAGGTLWGANAVNGVINVITRSAQATQGALAQAGVGSNDGLLVLRYGATLGESTALRLYAHARRSDFGGTGPLVADAAIDSLQGGFRIDGGAGRDSYTLQGDIYRNEVDLLDTSLTGGNLLGRWRHELSDRSAVQTQIYYDEAKRDYLVASDALKTLDAQLQQNLLIGQRHNVVWGVNYRTWKSEFNSLVAFGFARPSKTLDLASVFAQDDTELSPELTLTLGMKLEHNSYSGTDYLPTARLAWQANDQALLWSSVSRAVRTPSRIDRELEAAGFARPSPDFASETLTAFEVGYRGQPTANLSLSISVYYNVYDNLRTANLTNGGLPIFLANDLGGNTHGVEVWGAYALTPWWRMNFGLSTLKKNLKLDPGRIDLTRLQAAGQDPSYHALLRSQMNLGDRMELDFGLRAVGRVRPSNVPAYVEADARIGYRISNSLDLSLAGFNLLHDSHLESIDPSTAPVTAIPRTVFLTLRWQD